MTFSNYSIASMQVTRFLISQTGTYQDQFHRPYFSQLDGFQQNAIIETASRTREITPSLLAPMMSNFLTPSAAPESRIIIPNGYQEQRLRFVLELRIEDHIQCVTLLHISGWTDHMGLSMQSKHLDLDMRFVINNISRSRVQSLQTPMGMRTTTNMVESSHVLPALTNYGGLGQADKSFLMRPEDVMSQVDNISLRKGLDNNDFVYDARTVMTTQTRKSARSNASATDYAAQILNGYLQASQGEGDALSNTQILENARGAVMSDIAQRDPFISWLIQDSNGASRGDSFTLREILRLDPNALNDSVFQGPDINMSSPMSNVLHAGDSAHWYGNDAETLWATTLSQSVPAYMAKAGLTKIHFRATNEGIGGQVVVLPADTPKSLNTGVSLEPNWKQFQFMLENFVLRSLSYDNNLSYRVDMRCDMMGDTQIDVGLNGKPMIEYVWPTFLDAQNAPVVTKDEGRLTTLATDFSTLMDNVVDEVRFNGNRISSFGGGGDSGGGFGNGFGTNGFGGGDFSSVSSDGGPRI